MSDVEENVAEGVAENVVPKVAQKETMESLLAELGDRLLPFSEGEMVEATILAVGGNRIWVDVAGQSLGFIPEKEITSKAGLKVGDKVYCTVIAMEDDEGNVVLSLKRADREKYWLDLEDKFKTGEPACVKITDANKGGLMTEIGGIPGFIPVSQLSPSKYPRVEGGDKEEILSRLRRFIGQELMVKVINCDKEGNKLIFSEKAVSAAEVRAKLDKYQVGDKIDGSVTGIVDFGLFISIDPQIEGLVHISEVSWSRVSDLHKMFKVGDPIHAIIISIEEGRVSLSVKRLLPDPWVKAASKYKIGDVVKGEVTKITPFGAFVSLDEEIDGLVHISELSKNHVADPNSIVELGKGYEFKIISIEPESHRLGLSLKTEDKKEEAAEKPAKEKKAKKETTEEVVDSAEEKAEEVIEEVAVEEAAEKPATEKKAKKK